MAEKSTAKKKSGSSQGRTSGSSFANKSASSSSSYRQRKLREEEQLRNERISTAKDIVFLLIVGVCVLMAASWIAEDLLWLKDFTYKVFGLMLYPLPFIIAGTSWFLLFRPYDSRATLRLIALVLVIFALSGLMVYIFPARENAGGLQGRWNLLLFAKLGKLGTWVADLVLIAICSVIFTNFRLGESLGRISEDRRSEKYREEVRLKKERELEMQQEKREQIRRNHELRHIQTRQQEVEKLIEKNKFLEDEIAEKDRFIQENRDRFAPVFGIGDTTITDSGSEEASVNFAEEEERIRPEDFLKAKKPEKKTQIPEFLVNAQSKARGETSPYSQDTSSQGRSGLKSTEYLVSDGYAAEDVPVFPRSEGSPEKVVIPGFPGEASVAKEKKKPTFTIRGLSEEEKPSYARPVRETVKNDAVKKEQEKTSADEDPYRRREDQYVKTIITSSGRIISREVDGVISSKKESVPETVGIVQSSAYSHAEGGSIELADSDVRTSLPERAGSSYSLSQRTADIPVRETVEPVTVTEPAEPVRNSYAEEPEEEKPAFVPVPDELPEPGRRERKSSKKNDEEPPEELNISTEEPVNEYVFPPFDLLKKGTGTGINKSTMENELRETAEKLENTLKTFGVGVHVTDVSCGPTVTRYEIQPEVGVKVSRILNLADDIKLNLAAADIRIEAPIPGKSAIGIEIPNKVKKSVVLRDLLESDAFTKSRSKLAFAAGRDIEGNTVIADIAKMPHVLVAGATGSGKSVCINSIIMSILYHALPTDVKLIMVDPKMVELSVYNGIPHLLLPVVTDPKKAAAALNWAVAEMEQRYQLFAKYSVRSFEGFNELVDLDSPEDDVGNPIPRMPQILILVDELADLMMTAANDVENAICRLAQKARAAGIHLVLATQRPSVDVITGLIKANIPSRIAFAVSSGTDSRTILDMTGAESLLGAGDMLYAPAGVAKPVRVQGSFVSDSEVKAVVDFITGQGKVKGSEPTSQTPIDLNTSSGSAGGSSSERDEYYADSGRLVIEKEKASIGMLQRAFKLGFNRAARIVDQLAADGVVGEEEGTKPRRVLMTPEEFEDFLKTIGE